MGNPINYTAEWTSAPNIEAFLPAGGPPGSLNSSLVNPTTTSANVFAGQVLALTLNVDFSAAASLLQSPPAINFQTTGPRFGSLYYCPPVSAGPDMGAFYGQTISTILSAANIKLGGNTPTPDLDIPIFNNLVDDLNNALDNCIPNATYARWLFPTPCLPI